MIDANAQANPDIDELLVDVMEQRSGDVMEYVLLLLGGDPLPMPEVPDE